MKLIKTNINLKQTKKDLQVQINYFKICLKILPKKKVCIYKKINLKNYYLQEANILLYLF